jgi:hypothetical protein
MIDLSGLVPNWGKGARPICPRCRNDAVVDVGTERRIIAGRPADFDQCAPCPDCERGVRTEFGIGADDKPSGRSYYGPNGYWRGRTVP